MEMVAVALLLWSDPFRMSRPVARTEAAVGGRYPRPGLSPDSTDRWLDSFGRPQLPSSTNKAVNPIRRSSAGIQSCM